VLPLITKSAGLLVLSGAAALVYQVVWVRLMGLSMGSTSASVATVVAAFFGGLAIGSALADRLGREGRPTLRVYVLLEAVIAVCGLLSLPLLLNLDHLLAALPAGGTSLGAKFGIAMLVLALPTIAMGATFPVMAAALIREDQELAPRMSQFYALNTAGAVLGAWLGGFVLIPELGLDGAVYVAASLNVAAAALGWHLDGELRKQPEPKTKKSRKREKPKAQRTPASSIEPILDRTPGAPSFALAVLFTTGLVSISSEVAWTKYLAIFTGSTIYGFSAILVAFLIGVAGGAAIGRYIQAERPPTVLWLGVGMLTLAAALLVARFGLSLLPAIDFQIRAGEVSGLETTESMNRFRYFVITLILLAPTLVLGALFPASLSLWCGDAGHVPNRVGRGYAVNTASGILGSLLAGFWLIPSVGSDWVLSAGIVLVALVAATCSLAAAGGSRRLQLGVVGLLLAGLPFVLPGLDYERLISSAVNLPGAHIQKRGAPDFLFLEEGKVAVVSLLRWPEEDASNAYLHSNSLREAKLPEDPAEPPPRAEVFLGTLPVLVHPDPESMFIVGFGGGNTLKAALGTPISEVRVAELEPAMVDAVRSYRDGEVPALEDPRTTLLIGDARNILLVEKERTYDVLVSQPSHPWVAGAGNLFTKEFFEIARSRLNPGGVHGQWVSLFGLDAASLRSILAAFYGTYDHGFCIMLKNSGDLIMLGSDEPIKIDFGTFTQRVRNLETRAWFDAWRVRSAEAFLWYFALSREGALKAAKDTAPNRDTSIVSEVRGAFGRRLDRDDPASPYRVLEEAFRFDVVESLDPERAADALELMARTFSAWQLPGADARVRACLEQLAALDRIRADTVAAELRARVR
jgi:spermidine synthase